MDKRAITRNGAVCIIGSVAAQNYGSPLPQRPTAFAGAASVEPVRIRPKSRTTSQEQSSAPNRSQAQTTAQPVRQRGRVVSRSRDISQEEPQRQFARQRASSENDQGYTRPRVAVQTPVAATLPPQPQTTRLVTSKPVIEEEEDGDYISEEVEDNSGDAVPPNSISRSAYVGPFQPSLASPSIQTARPVQPIQTPPSFPRPAFLQPAAFRPPPQAFPPQNIQQPQPLPNSQPIGLVKQAPRAPQPLPQLRPLPAVTRPPIAVTPAYNSLSSSEEEEEEEEPQYVRQQPTRQQVKRPQSNEVEAYRQPSNKPQAPRQQQIIRNQDTSRPYPSKPSQVQKDRKPVVQTLRKYHNDNEDGSITWGYENDDGTFKEETIGNDCVTRGKYGYVDPDGVKREYTYQTGIPCDREAEAEIAASSNEGYIDYTNNKYVLPNGDEIDLDDMVKNRARKPSGKYRY